MHTHTHDARRYGFALGIGSLALCMQWILVHCSASNALAGDAWHMSTDILVTGGAFAAMILNKASLRRAVVIAGILLLAYGALRVNAEAMHRIDAGSIPVDPLLMSVGALIGLGGNAGQFLIIHPMHGGSLKTIVNAHLLCDVLISFAVLASAIIVYAGGAQWDAYLSFWISVYMILLTLWITYTTIQGKEADHHHA